MDDNTINSLLDNLDLPDHVKYQLKILIQYELPVDTGNLAYNALQMLSKNPGASYVINEMEADYTQAVFEHYLYNVGVNFMYDAARAVYNYLNAYFTGMTEQQEQHFKTAYRSFVEGYTEDNVHREVRNVLHGSGDYASETVKAQILGGKFYV